MTEHFDEEKTISNIRYRWYPSEEPWWVLLLLGIVIGGVGIIILSMPLMTVGLLAIIFGVLALVFGAIAFIRSFFLIKKDKNWWVMLLYGILGIILGIIILVWPIESTLVMVYFIAAFLILIGIFGIVAGSSEKSALTISMGVIGLVLGIFVLFRPPLYAIETLIGFVGLFLVIRGIVYIVQSIVIPIQRKNREKAEA